MDIKAVITGVGMITPLGVNATQTWASVQAGLTRMREAPDIYTCLPDDPDFEDGEALTASTLSYLESAEARQGRPAQWLASIAAQAFFDLQRQVGLEDRDDAGLGLFVSLPQPRPGWGPEQQEDFVYHFHNTIEKDLFNHEQFGFAGHAGALAWIEPACGLLAGGRLRQAVIGGVESYLRPDWLEVLDSDYRIKSDRNPDGFVPGEGAAWILLEPGGQPQKRNLAPATRISEVAYGTCNKAELAHNTGVALTAVLKKVLAQQTEAPVVFCDLNGEPARAKEWGYTMTRLGARLGDPLVVVHPADCLGDLGAASGAVLTGLATRYLHHCPDARDSVLVWTASDNGQRAALLLQKEEPMHGRNRHR